MKPITPTRATACRRFLNTAHLERRSGLLLATLLAAPGCFWQLLASPGGSWWVSGKLPHFHPQFNTFHQELAAGSKKTPASTSGNIRISRVWSGLRILLEPLIEMKVHFWPISAKDGKHQGHIGAE